MSHSSFGGSVPAGLFASGFGSAFASPLFVSLELSVFFVCASAGVVDATDATVRRTAEPREHSSFVAFIAFDATLRVGFQDKSRRFPPRLDPLRTYPRAD